MLFRQTPLDYSSPNPPVTATPGALDLDGMSMDMSVTKRTTPSIVSDPTTETDRNPPSVTASPKEIPTEEEPPWDDRPETATWAPLMEEASPPPSLVFHRGKKLPTDLSVSQQFFGPNWRSPSPVVLHIGGNPGPPRLRRAQRKKMPRVEQGQS